ncbi:MAG: thiolase family protein [Candidatus Omnitrophota bacterium]
MTKHSIDSHSPNEIYIVEALRTAIGGTNKALKDFSAVQLGGFVIKEILRQSSVPGDLVNQVILGNTVSAGLGQNPARHAAILGNLPDSVPALTINHVCGSGLQAVILAGQAIICQESDLVMAGGFESASRSPKILKKDASEKREDSDFSDSLIHDGLWCHITGKHMGELAEYLAEKNHISREEQDKYAYQSHLKACEAQELNQLAKEIVTVRINEDQIFTKDERPRRNISLERLSQLPAAFKDGGTVTAGNSCIPSDGAAVFLLASAQAVKKFKLKPKARVIAHASIAVEPKLTFTGSIISTEECLKKAKLKISDVDLFEISEAFAVQAIVTQQALKIPEEKMNIFGGDVALGHPLGAAGARILVTLVHALENQKKKTGLATVCLGGGGSVAVVIENLS